MTDDEIITTAVLHGCQGAFQSSNGKWYLRGVGVAHPIYEFHRKRSTNFDLFGQTTRAGAHRIYCEFHGLLGE